MEDLRLRGQGRWRGCARAEPTATTTPTSSVTPRWSSARQHAEALIQGDPDLTKDEHRPLAAVLRGRFAHRLALLGVA